MRLTIEIPDAEAAHWLARLHEFGLKLVDATAVPVYDTIPREEAENLRQALREVREADRGGRPLLTMAELFASLDDEEDDAV